MRENLLYSDYENYAKSVSKFGRHFLENHFTLKTIWWLMRSQPIEAVIQVSGEDIKGYSRVLRTFKGKRHNNINYIRSILPSK